MIALYSFIFVTVFVAILGMTYVGIDILIGWSNLGILSTLFVIGFSMLITGLLWIATVECGM